MSRVLFYVKLTVPFSDKKIKLIVDSGSPSNIIRESCVQNSRLINKQYKKIIVGLNSSNKIETLGTIFSYSIVVSKTFVFDVVRDVDVTFPQHIDGLLGQQALFSSNLNFEKRKLFLFDQLLLDLYPVNDLKHYSLTEIQNQSYQRVQSLLKILSLNHLDKNEFSIIVQLFETFSVVFFLEGDILKGTTLITHTITTSSDKPVFVKQYRTPENLRVILNGKIKEMLKQGIIVLCQSSPYNAPLFMVPKKTVNKSIDYRPVINFQELNKIIIPDRFPIPVIEDIIYNLSFAQVYSVLDLKSGYYQINIAQESMHKTAFSVNYAKYCFAKMPMGLVDSQATFQRLLNKILFPYIGQFLYVYVDDLIVFSQSFSDHVTHLSLVFEKLRFANLKLEPSKCKFAVSEVEYLGHVVSRHGLRPNEEKIKTIRDLPEPRNVKELKSFLGLASYYRKFIKNFATLAYPLNQLLHKDVKYNWSEPTKNSFNELKQKLISSPILTYPNFDKTFIITTDASNMGIGSVLSQIGEDGLDHPIGYASRSLNKSERNYSTFDREFLAILWAVTKQWRNFVYSRNFIVITDHLPLVSILKSRLDNGTPRIVRWKTQLLEFNFKILYKKGSLNVVADFLSRIESMPEDGAIIAEEKVYYITRNTEKASSAENLTRYVKFIEEAKNKSSLKLPSFMKESFAEIDYTSDDALKVAFVSKDHRELPENLNKIFSHTFLHLHEIIRDKNVFLIVFKESLHDPIDEKTLFFLLLKLRDFLIIEKKKIFHLKIINKELAVPYFVFREMLTFVFKHDKIKIIIFKETAKEVTDKKEQEALVHQFHSSLIGCHAGVAGTLNRLKKYHHWPYMSKTVEKIVKNCPQCQLNKRTVKKPIPLKITSSSSNAFDYVAIDIMQANRSVNGNLYLLTILDNLSRYLIGIPLPSQDAAVVAEAFIKHCVLVYGAPKYCLSDNGSNFLSQLFKEVCKIFKIKRFYTSVYHPQSNYDERIHQGCKNFLRITVDHLESRWCEQIPFYIFSYNTTKHSSLHHTPFELVFGRDAKLPFQDAEELPVQYTYDDYVNNLKFTLKKLAIDARANAEAHKQERKIRFDKNALEFDCKVGDLIKIKNNHNKVGGKLNPLFIGPFTIVEVNSPEYVTVLMKGKRKKYHKNLVYKFHEDLGNETDESINSLSSDDELIDG